MLLSVGVGVQEVLDTPLQRQHKELSALLFLGGKNRRKKSPPLPWARRVLAPAPEKLAQLRDVESQNTLSWK